MPRGAAFRAPGRALPLLQDPHEALFAAFRSLRLDVGLLCLKETGLPKANQPLRLTFCKWVPSCGVLPWCLPEVRFPALLLGPTVHQGCPASIAQGCPFSAGTRAAGRCEFLRSTFLRVFEDTFWQPHIDPHVARL